jgi:integrase
MQINKQSVAALTAADLKGKTDVCIWDDQLKGFGVRLRIDADKKLRKQFILQYRFEGRQRRTKLKTADADVARKKANSALIKLDEEGIDPQQEKERRRSEAALTFSKVVEQYIALKTDVRPSSLRLTKLYLTGKQYFGDLHARPLVKITRSHIATCLNSISVDSGAASASRARAHLAAFFVWCLQQGHCELNPVVGTANPKSGPPRDRVLSDDELVKVWRACDVTTDFGRIIRLLILLGARRQEIGGLLWREVDLEEKTITLSAERVKNKREHTLPLVPAAVQLIESVPHTRDHVFGSWAANGFNAWHQKDALRDGCKEWNIHDLRRSVATGMAEIGIEPHIIEAILNHASGHKAGVAGVYNRAQYREKIRIALVKWADHLDEIVNGRAKKIVPFAQRA